LNRGSFFPSGHCIRPASHTYSYSTLAAIASVAFVVACVAHEAVGHGGMCLALGGRITLLTSVYFRCANGGPLTDAAGPLMYLIVGAACWLLARGRPVASWSRLFFVLAMAPNLFWGAGYFTFSAATNTMVKSELGQSSGWPSVCTERSIFVIPLVPQYGILGPEFFEGVRSAVPGYCA